MVGKHKASHATGYFINKSIQKEMKSTSNKGYIYSRNSFVGYKLRLVLRVYDNMGYDFPVNIYTDNPQANHTLAEMLKLKGEEVKDIVLEQLSTKEQDDEDNKLINDFLSKLEDEN